MFLALPLTAHVNSIQSSVSVSPSDTDTVGHHACKYDSRQYQKLNDYKGEDCKAQQAAPASAICFKQVSPLSSITTRINVCTSLCSPGTNLPLMKTFDSFSTALQCCPMPWWRAVSAGPTGEMQPNWLLFIIEWRTMWKPALLPLPPHFPNLLVKTLLCWAWILGESCFIFPICSRHGWGLFYVLRDIYNLKLLASVVFALGGIKT